MESVVSLQNFQPKYSTYLHLLFWQQTTNTASIDSPKFLKAESSFTHSQQPACLPYPELKNSVHIFTLYWSKIQQQYHPTSVKFFILKVSMKFPSLLLKLNASQQCVKHDLYKWVTELETGTCFSYAFKMQALKLFLINKALKMYLTSIIGTLTSFTHKVLWQAKSNMSH